MDLVAALQRLLALAECDPERACREFDVLVACFGAHASAQALRAVAGPELDALGFAA